MRSKRSGVPRLATWISEIGYLPLPSHDMTEIPLKRRKSSIQPTNILTKRDEAFIIHVSILCGKTFQLVPKILTLWPWPWLLTYFWKNLTLALTFEPREIGLSYYAWIFLVARPFCSYQNFNFDPMTLTSNLTYFRLDSPGLVMVWLPPGERCCLLITLIMMHIIMTLWL